MSNADDEFLGLVESQVANVPGAADLNLDGLADWYWSEAAPELFVAEWPLPTRENEAQVRRAHVPEDLAALLAGGLEPPAQLIEGLVVEGQVNWLAGHPAQGKTTVALWSAAQHLEAGGHVIWLDWEAGPRDTVLRLEALGASHDQIIDRFHYFYSPLVPADEHGLELLRGDLERWPNALVVFDSASKALSIAGLDENTPAEATRWTTEVVMPLPGTGRNRLCWNRCDSQV